MSGGHIIGILLIIGGIILLSLSGESRLVIRGTNISYGWFLVVFGGIKLLTSSRDD